MDILERIRFSHAEIDETGKTFMENARIKALAGAKHSGMICLERIPLEVDSLMELQGEFPPLFRDGA